MEPLKGQYKAVASHMPVGQVRGPTTVAELGQGRRRFTDQVEMVAYRAETKLANLVGTILV